MSDKYAHLAGPITKLYSPTVRQRNNECHTVGIAGANDFPPAHHTKRLPRPSFPMPTNDVTRSNWPRLGDCSVTRRSR